jgi:hypothetical protein
MRPYGLLALAGRPLADGTGNLILTRIRAGLEVAIARRLVTVGSELVTPGARWSISELV